MRRRRPVGQLPGPVAALSGVTMVIALAGLMAFFRTDISGSIPALVLVVPVVAAGVAGGRWPAWTTAVVAASAFNLAFIPPYWTLRIHAPDDLLALAIYIVVATVVGTLVSLVGERRRLAEDRAGELAALNRELVEVQVERERLSEEATRATVLERVDEQRAALLRSVSHDLRTPLSSIRGVASDLLSDADYDEATRRQLIGLVADEAERLDRLVANLLNLSRIEAGALHPDSDAVAIDELVAGVLTRLERVLRGVRVQTEVPAHLPAVHGDYTQLDQVVSNLVENAARHAPPRSMLRVGARAMDGRVEVWVDDEGGGVLPFERHRIFEPFQHGEGSGSSGVGLAICKAIVEAHGGSIGVTGGPGGGARFAFTVPVHRE